MLDTLTHADAGGQARERLAEVADWLSGPAPRVGACALAVRPVYVDPYGAQLLAGINQEGAEVRRGEIGCQPVGVVAPHASGQGHAPIALTSALATTVCYIEAEARLSGAHWRMWPNNNDYSTASHEFGRTYSERHDDVGMRRWLEICSAWI